MKGVLTRSIVHAPHMMPKDEPKIVSPPAHTVIFVHTNSMSKARHLIAALRQWNKEGRPMASKELRKQRLKACHACELWNPNGNWGLGECGAPGCGCTKFKAWLENSLCPHPSGNRWPDVSGVTTDKNDNKKQP